MTRVASFLDLVADYKPLYLAVEGGVDHSLEDLLGQAQEAGLKVTIEVGPYVGEERIFAARVCPFKQETNKEVMTLAKGYTIAEAVYVALSAVEGELWCQLDWAARPWVTSGKRDGTFKLR